MRIRDYIKEKRVCPFLVDEKRNTQELVNAINNKYLMSEKIESLLTFIATRGILYAPQQYFYRQVWKKYIFNAEIDLIDDSTIGLLIGKIDDSYIVFRGAINGKKAVIVNSLDEALGYQ